MFKKSQVLKMSLCLVVGLLLFSSCSSKSSPDEPPSASYSIDGESITEITVNKTISTGEPLTIEATIGGPSDLGVYWVFEASETSSSAFQTEVLNYLTAHSTALKTETPHNIELIFTVPGELEIRAFLMTEELFSSLFLEQDPSLEQQQEAIELQEYWVTINLTVE